MLTIRNRFALALIAFAGWALVAMPPAAGQQPAGGAGPFTAKQIGCQILKPRRVSGLVVIDEG